MLNRKNKLLLYITMISCFLFTICCSVPRNLFSQKDIESSEVGSKGMEKRVLIASQSSEFKNAIIDELKDAFSADSIYAEFTGLNALKEKNVTGYSAVVIINTCIAWGMDSKVQDFLNRNEESENIVVLVTSGDGNWLPEKDGREFDAISAASKMDGVEKVSEEIIQKIQEKI